MLLEIPLTVSVMQLPTASVEEGSEAKDTINHYSSTDANEEDATLVFLPTRIKRSTSTTSNARVMNAADFLIHQNKAFVRAIVLIDVQSDGVVFILTRTCIRSNSSSSLSLSLSRRIELSM